VQFAWVASPVDRLNTDWRERVSTSEFAAIAVRRGPALGVLQYAADLGPTEDFEVMLQVCLVARVGERLATTAKDVSEGRARRQVDLDREVSGLSKPDPTDDLPEAWLVRGKPIPLSAQVSHDRLHLFG
jgi:hypothetical protein